MQALKLWFPKVHTMIMLHKKSDLPSNLTVAQMSCFENFKELAFHHGATSHKRKEEQPVIDVGGATISAQSSPYHKKGTTPSAMIDLRAVMPVTS